MVEVDVEGVWLVVRLWGIWAGDWTAERAEAYMETEAMLFSRGGGVVRGGGG